MTTLERVRANAGPYPTHLLEGCESGLLLFGAAFLGANDAVHFLDAGLKSMVVDTDLERLKVMSELYPADWGWSDLDAWTFASRRVDAGVVYDAVSVDTWTGDLMDRSLHSLELWCSLARKFVTVTIGFSTSFLCPVGWKFSLFARSGNARWLILERI